MSLRFSNAVSMKDLTTSVYKLMNMGFRDCIYKNITEGLVFVDFTGDERISMSLVGEEYLGKDGKCFKSGFPFFEFNTDCFDEFSKYNNYSDYSPDYLMDHQYMISPELYCRKDPDGYLFTFSYTKDFKTIDLLNWSREEEALFEVANYDVAIKLHVSDILKSKEFYLNIGFIPDFINNACNDSASLILKHEGVPGLKMILLQEGNLSNRRPEESGSEVFEKEFSYILIPKTNEDLIKIQNYFLERELVTKAKATDNGSEIIIGSAGDVHFEILNIKIN
jgi:hypothetical protein